MTRKIFHTVFLYSLITAFSPLTNMAYAAGDPTEKDGCGCKVVLERGKSKYQFKITPGSACDKDKECKKLCIGSCPRF